MNRTAIPYLDFTWNPSGAGCSKGCPGCWARRCAPRVGAVIGCRKCAAFKPHFHPERLKEPGRRRKPAVIGVDFMADLFDYFRPDDQIQSVGSATLAAPQHTYVWLTQNPDRLGDLRQDNWNEPRRGEHYFGVTVRSEVECRWQRLGLLRANWGKLWISFEPLLQRINLNLLYRWDERLDETGPQRLDGVRIAGVVIGCHSDRAIPFRMAWLYDLVEQCIEAGIPHIYVKQLRIDGRLVTEPAQFPAELQRFRSLPWQLQTKSP